MNILQRAQSAHRHEALTHAVLATALVACALMVVGKVGRSVWVGEVPAHWPQLALGSAALVLGAFVLIRTGRQSAYGRANLTDTPLGLIVDLVRLRERELHAWLGRWSWGTTGALAVVAVVVGVARVVEARSAQEPTGLAWGSLVFSVIGIVAVAVTGFKRVLFLRRELAALGDLQRQLASHEHEHEHEHEQI